jgi:hypothetical protein
MVPLLGFAALSVDLGNLYLKHQQLQSGADAGAFAVAQSCARDGCSASSATAQTLAVRNLTNATPQTTVTLAPGRVDVAASTTVNNFFAPVLGVNSSQVRARATVRYGAPSGGRAMLPLAFSWCEFRAQTGGGLPSATSSSTPRIVKFTKTSGTTCTGPSNNVVPGGFGWLKTTAGCTSTSKVGQTVFSDPGSSVPTGCSTTSFEAMQNRTVLLPLFDQAGDSGTNAFYHLYGYAAFTLTGYDFGGQYAWNKQGCNANDRCIKGYFTRFVDLSEAFDYGVGAPQLGASVVRLTA